MSSPIPHGRQVVRVLGENSACGKSNSLGAMVFPISDSERFARGMFPHLITRGRGDMGRASAAGVVTHFCALRHVSRPSSLARPRARSRNSRHNAPAPAAAPKRASANW